LLLEYPASFSDADRADSLSLVRKFQQLTAPVTAKGIEDTVFYVYNRLISLNEVGGDPGRFGIDPYALHQWLRDRQEHWPLGLSPLSTHDTKRSEDVRARLNVLSEFPEEWWQRVARWSRLNEPHQHSAGGKIAPDRNDEYLIYQSLVGIWPMNGGAPTAELIKRMQEYLTKAMREAKVQTSWTDPNAAYEAAVANFIARILSSELSPLFLQDFRAFQRRVNHFGILNSLSQTVLRLTAPGVPDTYQGSELWDLSLVDPDNRRPVDYALRAGMLKELQNRVCGPGESRIELIRELIAAREDGRIKLFVTWLCLSLRRELPALFSRGEYVPLEVEGRRRDHAFAFLRHGRDGIVLVVVPRLISRLVTVGEWPLRDQLWGDTRILLPKDFEATAFRNQFTGERVAATTETEGRAVVRLGEVFTHFPVAVLVAG
jgi:(1->4)-alpha-D-glucan 1-alpha-D-glucosylmutase